MSFFEPLPPPPPEPVRQWSPPLWDRPSEGTVPAIVPVNEIVHRDDEVVVALEHLRAYPNGFTINLLVLTNPHRELTGAQFEVLGGGHPGDLRRRFPRIGVRFADGRTAGRQVTYMGPPDDIPKDDQGIPTEPIIRLTGAGGGSHGYHVGVWVFPLPPDGPLGIHVSLPGRGDDEAMVTVDGGAVRAAAGQAVIIWG